MLSSGGCATATSLLRSPWVALAELAADEAEFKPKPDMMAEDTAERDFKELSIGRSRERMILLVIPCPFNSTSPRRCCLACLLRSSFRTRGPLRHAIGP